MKKRIFFALLLPLAAMLAMSLPMLAEGVAVAPAPQLFNWESILTSVLSYVIRVLGAALLTGLGYLAQRYLLPWLKEHRLTNVAVEMVMAAEAKFGRQNGMQKLEQVLSWMRDKNLHVDDEAIRQAILAAWQDLDLKMIEVGLKLPPDHPPEE